ncbi:MAG: 4Fe-4S dicluster domain-containing protein [Gammaproteobacteria bacterium]|nr:4Fe-4S dicluster domain-containing protein [Gammaproteobacteria bacterium]
MKAYTENELHTFFKSLTADYSVQVPVKLHDGTRTLGELDSGDLTLAGGALPMRPTSVFAPYQEVVLTFKEKKTETTKETWPIFVVGFTAEDADCLEYIDKFYSKNYVDFPYFNKRQNAVVVCVTGKCGAAGELLKIANGKCDFELIALGNGEYIPVAYSDPGKNLVAKISGGKEVSSDTLDKLKSAAEKLSQEDTEMLQKVSALILANKVPDEFWQTISDRCISCTACTLCCPTCTCFDVFDRKSLLHKNIERVRLRDSCLLDGFMREASGHNPMAKESQRTRRRIHHKLAADVKRNGVITCFLCGRCDKVCPSNIGIKSVCRELLKYVGA